MKKWFRKLAYKMAQFMIICGQNTIASLDLLDNLEKMEKGFKDKIDK